jgi:hypothetical protein
MSNFTRIYFSILYGLSFVIVAYDLVLFRHGRAEVSWQQYFFNRYHLFDRSLFTQQGNEIRKQVIPLVYLAITMTLFGFVLFFAVYKPENCTNSYLADS